MKINLGKTLLATAAICLTACSQQSAVQNNLVAAQLARSLPAGTVTTADGKTSSSSDTPQVQQTKALQALMATQNQHVNPAQQAALQRLLSQQQPTVQQQGAFNNSTPAFGSSTPAKPWFNFKWPFATKQAPPNSTIPVYTTPPNNINLPWANGFKAY